MNEYEIRKWNGWHRIYKDGVYIHSYRSFKACKKFIDQYCSNGPWSPA